MSNQASMFNPVPSMVKESPKPSPQPIADFLETRNFTRLFGALGVGSAAVGAYLLYQKYAEKAEEKKGVTEELTAPAEIADIEELKEEEKKVILYQVPRGFFTPAVAPFALKLETFMRVANITYEVHLSTTKHEVDTPWIKIGDEEIRKNNECTNFLSKKFDINLSKGASNSRKTASRMVDVMLENRVYWGIALWRWVYDEGKSLKDIQPLVPSGEAVLDNVRDSVIRAAHYNGIGRFSKEDVILSVIQDLGHLSAALGKHSYFMGEAPGEVDCNAFSLLAQMIWNMPGSPFEEAIKKHKVLMDFVIRMREKFWPDWDDLIQNPQTSKVSSQALMNDTSVHNNIENPTSGLQQTEATTSITTTKSIGTLKGQIESQSAPVPTDSKEFSTSQPNRMATEPDVSNSLSNEQSKNIGLQQEPVQHSQLPQSTMQIKNHQQVLRSQIPHAQQQQSQPAKAGTTIREIQYQKPKVNLTEEQKYQIQNHHNQTLFHGENQNKFLQVQHDTQDVNNYIGNNVEQYETQPQTLPQYFEQAVQLQSQQLPMMQMNYASDAGQYFPEVNPAFIHENLQRAAQATLYYPIDQNQGYGQAQFLGEQGKEQCQRLQQVDALDGFDYPQQGNFYAPPGPNQSQIYGKYWN